jgi:proteasome lid subunit RPN8/RPN11
MLKMAYLPEVKQQPFLRDAELTLRNLLAHVQSHPNYFPKNSDEELRVQTDLLLHLINTHKSKGGFDKQLR